MKQKDLYYLAIILLILTVAFFMGQRQGKTIEQLRNQNEFLENRVHELEQVRDSATARADREEHQRAIIIKTAMTEQTTLRAEIQRLRNRRTQISTTGTSVQPERISIDSAALLVNCDSLVESLTSLTVSLEGEKLATTASFERQIQDIQEALKAEHAISETWRESAQDNSKRLRRQTRAKKVWRNIAVIATVGITGVFLGSQ